MRVAELWSRTNADDGWRDRPTAILYNREPEVAPPHQNVSKQCRETIDPPAERDESPDLKGAQSRRENVPPEQEAVKESIFDRDVVSACVDASGPVTMTKADASIEVE